MSNENEEEKICFLICPIGEEGSETREHADVVKEEIVKPAVEEYGYTLVRADEISTPGVITRQIITHLINDQLVIADLTDHNPNVFYELAIRHGANKPIIQMIREGENIPFDVGRQRTIFYTTRADKAKKARKQIKQQISAIEESSELPDNPIEGALSFEELRRSDNPVAESIEQMMELLEEIREEIRGVTSRSPSHIGKEKIPISIDYDQILKEATDKLKIKAEIASILEGKSPRRVIEDSLEKTTEVKGIRKTKKEKDTESD